MSDKLFPAKWVGFEKGIEAPMVRKEFNAESVNKAKIEICGLGNFYTFINGKIISDDLFVPAQTNYGTRDTSKFLYPINDTMTNRIYYLKYDISDFLENGGNTLGIMLGNGWYNQNKRTCEGQMSFGEFKLIFRITLYNENGEKTYIVSDNSLKWQESFVKKNNLFYGEMQDINLFDDCWKMSGFDDWDWRYCAEIDKPDCIFEEQTFPADKVIRTIKPTLIFVEKDRKVYDMGENITGWVKLKLSGQKGDSVTVKYSEEINGNILDFESAGGIEQIQKNEYICNGKPTEVHPLFVYHSFRYCEVLGSGEAILCEVVHTPLENTAHFECDNELLNWVYDAYVRTQLDGVHMSVPLDCPHRERLGYTGDGQITAASVMSIFDAREFYKKWIKDIIDCQDINNGHIQHTAPFNGGGGGPGGWGSAIVGVPYMYYKYYGDKAILEQTYPAMKKWVGYMQSRSEDFLVVSEEKDGWCLGEWSTVGEVKIPPEFVNTYYLVKSLQRMKKICKVIEVDFEYDSLLENCILSIKNHFYNSEKNCFTESLQGADAFAADIGIANEKILEKLALEYSKEDCITTGIFGTEVVIRLLFKNGYADAALKYITVDGPYSFANMKRKGATTLWEWMMGDYSHNHPMFGGFIACLFEYLGGIRQSFEGKIEIVPCEQNMLNNFSVSRQTPKGFIEIKYLFDGSQKIFEVTVPSAVKYFTYKKKQYELTEGKNIFKF